MYSVQCIGTDQWCKSVSVLNGRYNALHVLHRLRSSHVPNVLYCTCQGRLFVLYPVHVRAECELRCQSALRSGLVVESFIRLRWLGSSLRIEAAFPREIISPARGQGNVVTHPERFLSCLRAPAGSRALAGPEFSSRRKRRFLKKSYGKYFTVIESSLYHTAWRLNKRLYSILVRYAVHLRLCCI